MVGLISGLVLLLLIGLLVILRRIRNRGSEEESEYEFEYETDMHGNPITAGNNAAGTGNISFTGSQTPFSFEAIDSPDDELFQDAEEVNLV
jgi:hypothetical protein